MNKQIIVRLGNFTKDCSVFLEITNEDSSSFSEEFLGRYPEADIAFVLCELCHTKKVNQVHLYGSKSYVVHTAEKILEQNQTFFNDNITVEVN